MEVIRFDDYTTTIRSRSDAAASGRGNAIATACVRTRSPFATPCSRPSSPSTPARRAWASSIVSSARCSARPRHPRVTRARGAGRRHDQLGRDALGARRSSARPRSGLPCRASRPDWPSPAPVATSSSSRRRPPGGKLVLTGQLGDVMKESARIALSRPRPAAELGIDDGAFERVVPPPRARGRDPEGRPERRHHDGDRAGVAPLQPAGGAHGRHDGRGDAAGPGAADRRPQAEGARRARRRADRRRSSRSATAPTSTTCRSTSATR